MCCDCWLIALWDEFGLGTRWVLFVLLIVCVYYLLDLGLVVGVVCGLIWCSCCEFAVCGLVCFLYVGFDLRFWTWLVVTYVGGVVNSVGIVVSWCECVSFYLVIWLLV